MSREFSHCACESYHHEQHDSWINILCVIPTFSLLSIIFLKDVFIVDIILHFRVLRVAKGEAVT
jgi:hypothetical protein